MSSTDSLKKLMLMLEQNNIELEEIAHLEAIVESSQKPFHKRAIDVLQNNWNRLRGEMKESTQMSSLLQKAYREGKETLSPEEKKFIQAQLHDFFRIFPATIIAGMNAVLPIPGTVLLTPLILRKLGLLPSRWREAYLLNTLQEAYEKRKKTKNIQEITLLEEISEEIHKEAEYREKCELLFVWDENNNGIWDENELQSYGEELRKTCILYADRSQEKAWFFLYEGLVFGPNRLDQFSENPEELLVCYQNETKWVLFRDIQKAIVAP